jgi:hypothetical protein
MDNSPRSPSSIGTERESSLHRSLKFRYTGTGAVETAVENYVCDGVNEAGEIIEVQTGSFAPLREKVRRLSVSRKVRIVHPIILRKDIEIYDEKKHLVSRRKIPRKGSVWDLFKALIYAPELPLLPGLSIELALVDIAEQRIRNGLGSWRRRGDSIADRVLTGYHGSLSLARAGDYLQFIPFGKDEEFIPRELGEKAGIRTAMARKTLYVLTRIGLTTRIGKRSRSWVYRRADSDP